MNALRSFAILCHRWMGVAFCLLFAWWFVSGIFMMYTDYPSVGPRESLAHAQTIDAGRIRLAPREAAARLRSFKAAAFATISISCACCA